MENKSIIIIGGGVSGLSAGCYAQMNGYHSQVFEMHNRSGGVCTGWYRQGFTVNGSIQWLVGSSERISMHKIWKELGVIGNVQFVDHDRFMEYRDLEGKNITLFVDVERLEKTLLEVAPEDTQEIKKMMKAIRVFSKYDMEMDKAPELMNVFDYFTFLIRKFPLLTRLIKWSQVSIQDYTQKLKSKVLKEMLLQFFMPEMSMTVFLYTIAWLNQKSAGYPLGGSANFAQLIEKRYKDLGGKIHFESEVAKILTSNGKATGIELKNGTRFTADVVISAADGYTTIFEMLEGKFVNDAIKAFYQTLPLFPAILFVSLGVNRKFNEVADSVSGIDIPFPHPIQAGEQTFHRLTVQIYNFDPNLAPEGKTLLTCMLKTDYSYWEQLYTSDHDQYEKEKMALAQQVAGALEVYFPGIKTQVEMIDVASPVTYVHYTGNYRGSFEGWLPTPAAFRARMKKTLPGLDNFYMIGQWVEPGGGLPPAAFSGRNVIQLICNKDKRVFKTTTPEKTPKMEKVV